MKYILLILMFVSGACKGQIVINTGFSALLDCTTTDASGIGISDHTYTAGRLYLFVVMTTGTTNPGTASGTTLTWTSVMATGNSTRRIQVFRAMPSVTTAATEDVVINTFGGGSTGYMATVWEVTGVVTTGTNGADAIVQAVSGGATGTDPSITMAAITSSRNTVLSIFNNDANPFGGTEESGWTEVTECGYSTPTAGGYVMRRYLTTDNTPTVTASSSTWIGVAIELQSAGRRIFNTN